MTDPPLSLLPPIENLSPSDRVSLGVTLYAVLGALELADGRLDAGLRAQYREMASALTSGPVPS